MTTESAFHPDPAQVAHVMNTLCTRTLNHFAQEAKLEGESLRDAFNRYEIDYAWHVLGSDRMVTETVSFLETRQERPVSDEQKACVVGILKSAAQEQAPELLMSFDNDVPQLLADFLHASWSQSAA